MIKKANLTVIFVSVFFMCVISCVTGKDTLVVKPWQRYSVIPKYEVFEVILSHSQEYDNPFLDVSIKAFFTSPSGKQFKVGGFHYGSINKPTIKKELPTDGKGGKMGILLCVYK
jgi:hypothetical protein